MTEQNDFIQNEQGDVTQKKKGGTKAIIIALAVIIVLAIVALIVFSNAKLALGLTLKSVPKQISNFMKTDNYLVELFETQSHSVETEVDLSDLMENLEIDLLTQYQNETGDGLIEISTGIGEAGIYLEGDEIAAASSLSDFAIGIDTSNDFDLSKDVTLVSRIVNLPINHQNDAQIQEYLKDINAKLQHYGKVALKELPRKSLSKGSEKIEIMGKEKNTKYVEIVLDNDEIKDLLEVVLEEAEDDDEFHDMITGLIDYVADKYDFDSEIDTDDIDIDDAIEEMIDELDYLEMDDLEIKLYHQGYKFVGFNLEYKDYNEFEIFTVIASDNNSKYLEIGAEAYSKFEMLYSSDSGNVIFELDAADAKVDFEISGSSKEKDIEGKIVSYGDEVLSMDGTYEKSGDETIISLEGDIEGSKAELEYVLTEIRKNKEYEAEISITADNFGEEMEIGLDQTMLFGDIDDPDLGSWSSSQTFTYGDLISGKVDLEDEFEDFIYELQNMFQ